MGAWLNAPRFAVILGLLIIATYPQVILGLQTFVVRDFGFFAYPLAYFQREAFWHGTLPLWNPYNNCGVPFLAQWNTMPLYPPALLYLVFPLNWALGWFCLLHLFLAGFGMYRLAFRWTGSPLGAAVAGIAFSFNGLTLNLLMWPSHIATFAWVPWVLLETERAWQSGGRYTVRAALIGALQMLAGGPETILMTWLLLAALWVGQAVRRRIARPTSAGGEIKAAALWRFPLIVVLVAALAAIQLLPFLDLASHSQRETGYADTRWSIPPRGWANFFVPMAFGRVWNMGVFFQHGQAWTSSYYISLVVLVLALLAIITVREARVWFLAVVGAFALLLAFGDHALVYQALRRVLPQISLITYPVKFVTVVVVAVPLLAAYGVRALDGPGQASGKLRRQLLLSTAGLLGVIGAVLLWAWLRPLPHDNPEATLRNGLGRAAFLAVSAGVWLLWASLRAGRWQRLLPLGLLMVGWLDVDTHMPTQNPTVSLWLYTPNLVRAQLEMQPQPELGESRAMVLPTAETGLMGFTMTHPGTNYLIKRLGYFADCNLLDQVPKVNGFFSLYPKRAGELVSIVYASTNVAFPRLADFMGVSQISSATRFFEWERRSSYLPLITGGHLPIYLDDAEAVQAILRKDFQPEQVVILPPEAKAEVTVTNSAAVRIEAARFGLDRVNFEAQTEVPALITISHTYYHNWKATIDGKPTPLLRANYAFQAIQLPPGKHQVELVYRERTLVPGAIISLIGLAGLLWFGCRKRESHGDNQ